MEERLCRELVCKRLCTFYKPGREPMKCGTVEFIERNLTARELRMLVENDNARNDFSEDESIRTLICRECNFHVDGCDFRAGLPSPPCGGYVIVETLLKGSRHLSHSVWLCHTSSGWKSCR